MGIPIYRIPLCKYPPVKFWAISRSMHIIATFVLPAPVGNCWEVEILYASTLPVGAQISKFSFEWYAAGNSFDWILLRCLYPLIIAVNRDCMEIRKYLEGQLGKFLKCSDRNQFRRHQRRGYDWRYSNFFVGLKRLFYSIVVMAQKIP